MPNSRRNSLLCSVLIFVIGGCVTSIYQLQNQFGSRVELVVSPDRVLVECEYQGDYSGDIKRPHGFMIHVLDEENTVLGLSHGTVLDENVCFERLHAIRKILKNSRTVHIGGIGDISKPREQKGHQYEFPGLGTYHYNGRHLAFMAIWNSEGQCYDNYYGNQKPCPRDEFSPKQVR
jgi:hypothetical protein